MRWGQGTRLVHLREKILPKDGVIWQGTPEQFLEFVTEAVSSMPLKTQEAMTRFYLSGESPAKAEDTGKLTTAESRFYLETMSGRAALVTILKRAEQGGWTTLVGIYGKR